MPNLLTHINTNNNEKLTINSVHYIAGTATKEGVWLGVDDSIDEYYDGLTIAYKIPIRGASEVTLNIRGAGETWLGAKKVYTNGGSPLTYDYDGGTLIFLVYSTNTNFVGWRCTSEQYISLPSKYNTNTEDVVYVVTNLEASGSKYHTITPTYTGVPSKAYVDKIATGHVKYLGTVAATSGLSTTAGQGDFYRVSTAFTFGSETAHVGDIVLATKDNPSQNATDWDLIHTEVDSNTWTANSVSAAGYVSAPGSSAANKVWKTDANGNPAWRDDANTDTHYTKYLQIKGNGTEAVKFTQDVDKSLNLKPGNNVSISAASGEITINATDTKVEILDWTV